MNTNKSFYLAIIIMILILWIVYVEIRMNNIKIKLDHTYILLGKVIDIDVVQSKLILNNTYANKAQWRIIKLFINSINTSSDNKTNPIVHSYTCINCSTTTNKDGWYYDSARSYFGCRFIRYVDGEVVEGNYCSRISNAEEEYNIMRLRILLTQKE